jgi:hypothetical protein
MAAGLIHAGPPSFEGRAATDVIDVLRLGELLVIDNR